MTLKTPSALLPSRLEAKPNLGDFLYRISFKGGGITHIQRGDSRTLREDIRDYIIVFDNIPTTSKPGTGILIIGDGKTKTRTRTSTFKVERGTYYLKCLPSDHHLERKYYCCYTYRYTFNHNPVSGNVFDSKYTVFYDMGESSSKNQILTSKELIGKRNQEHF